ncbi:histidine kinase [Bdellovibrio bacteriovorus]|uniref:Histidine kinase n=1 Tax=Bdellovibrio bacteriovorus TaxID=959 RepID=A0A150WMP7_BDEBC|nr:response regulator [Bdellovibrio bacteriovorus]KYG65773.1 histidine kinase [Bdellovibrio bacteriovorus]
MARILIVDDQKSVLLTLEALLTGAGYAVIACTNALDALKVLTSEPMDLLITDAIMPGGADGYALTRTVRKEPALAKLPVILLTGKREKEDVEKGIESGVNDYVVKPLDPELLLAKIQNLLKTKPEESAHFAQARVHYQAEWDTKTEITSVSELGMDFKSLVPMPLGKILRVHSSIFGDVGIREVAVRVDHCEEITGVDGFYKITTHFVGITEKELSPLRLWIRAKRTF